MTERFSKTDRGNVFPHIGCLEADRIRRFGRWHKSLVVDEQLRSSKVFDDFSGGGFNLLRHVHIH